MAQTSDASEALTREVRLFVFGQAADTARVPQPSEIAAAFGRPQAEVEQALRRLAAGKVLILARKDLLGHLYLGCARRCGCARHRCHHPRIMRRLQRADAAGDQSREADAQRGNYSLCCSSPSLVGQHWIHVKHNASLPWRRAH